MDNHIHIRGHVLDLRTAAGVSGVTVVARMDRAATELGRAVSDSQGGFEIESRLGETPDTVLRKARVVLEVFQADKRLEVHLWPASWPLNQLPPDIILRVTTPRLGPAARATSDEGLARVAASPARTLAAPVGETADSARGGATAASSLTVPTTASEAATTGSAASAHAPAALRTDDRTAARSGTTATVSEPAVAPSPGSSSASSGARTTTPGARSSPNAAGNGDSVGRGTPTTPASRQLAGQILMEHGLPASGLTLRLYRIGFGGTETKVAEARTGGEGLYALPANPSPGAQWVVRAVDAQGKEISLSEPMPSTAPADPINLVAPASLQASVPEYRQLSGDLKAVVGELGALRGLQENDQRKDLSLLHETTGWDAKLIATAANANRLRADIAANGNVDLPDDGLYAMLRMGLPADAKQLAAVGSATVEQALRTAGAAGVVEMNDQRVAEIKLAFAKFSRETRLADSVPGSNSTYRKLLSNSGLSREKQDRFADVYLEHRGTGDELWRKLKASGFEQSDVDALRLQGKLAYLTHNNDELIASLKAELKKEADLPRLVELKLDTPEGWAERLRKLAGGDEARLAALIPPAFMTLDAYSKDMARKVEASYPNHVVGRRVADDKLVGDDSTLVRDLLRAAAALPTGDGKGRLNLGSMSVDKLVRLHRDKLFPPGTPKSTIDKTTTAARVVQRVYQFTPSNDAMKVLFEHGLESAHAVTAVTKEEFLARYGRYFASPGEAETIYDKAAQITGVVQNAVHLSQQLAHAVQPMATAGGEEQRKSANAELLKHYPTMETLFGSLDFCECEHCQSVLSPAAYLVDLLNFINPEGTAWEGFLNDWTSKHDNTSYADSGFMKPFDALQQRRPDLENIPLTCENTNTALPYIDLVNEILEYYVAHLKLDQNAARDTGDATTPELLAEPQNVISDAYAKLARARYPIGLPFDLWHESVRAFLERFDTPFWRLLEVARPTDKLLPPATPENPQPAYYRRDVFIEQLGLSSAEWEIFTDPSPLAKWHELYGYASAAAATAVATDAYGRRTDLNSAKVLSRKLGLTYKQLVEIIQTGFVNPHLRELGFLTRLGISADDFFRYKQQPGHAPLSGEEAEVFAQRLADRAAELGTTAAALIDLIEARWSSVRFADVLLLRDTDAKCNFEKAELQHADGRVADPLTFLKLNLFVRLWRKIGWSIDETDRALQTFVPTGSGPLTETNIGAAMQTALTYLAHMKNLSEQVNVGKNARQKLLTLWSDLPTAGKAPLYAQLFLNRGILKSDPVFDDPLGDYLAQSKDIPLKDHLLAVQGALGLTGEEILRIVADADGKSYEDAAVALDRQRLTLPTVSLIYRYGLVAKAAKLPVADVIRLKALSGVNPVKALSDRAPRSIDDDYPWSQTLRFMEITENIKSAGLKVADIDYLLRHVFDPVGKYRPDDGATLSLVKSLAGEIRRIRAENAVPEDPTLFSDEVFRQKLASAVPADVAETFFAMWAGTKEYAEAYPAQVPPASQLLPEAFASEPSIRVSYNAASQRQTLTFRGVLTDQRKAALKAKFPSPIVGALLDQVQSQAKDYFAKNLGKSATVDPPIGFMNSGDFEVLFAPLPDGTPDVQAQAALKKKRYILASALLPFLQQKLIRQAVVQILAARFSADAGLTESLLTNSKLLTDPSDSDKTLLDAFSTASDPGFTQDWFASPDASGTPLPTATAANSSRFTGVLEVSTAGAYRFFVKVARKDAEAELRFAHLIDPIARGMARHDGDVISGFVELKPGVPYAFTLVARGLNGGSVDLTVLGENLPEGSLDRLTLYPGAAVRRVRRAEVRLSKALQLVRELNLSEREVRHLLTHATDFDGLSFDDLPTEVDERSVAEVQASFARFHRLVDYALLKRELSAQPDELVGVFESARQAFATSADESAAKEQVFADACQRLADLIRRDANAVKTAARKLGFAATSSVAGSERAVAILALANEKGLRRLWDVLQIAERLGVTVDALWRWATPGSRESTARDVRETIKAKYEPEEWQHHARPIFDTLRQKQRDGLVAHVMQNHPERFENPNQLFEYFLVDPGMEPVVQTSRIRLAISSVQLFIQRCLLNLERHVHPSTINSKQWQWMKRYRVWEANRKIFLYPENWLEPEFRDDRTHLFQELEGALLQGDVSNDLVENAFFNYVKKLEELAHLDVVSMYCEENAANPEANTLHVIGRTRRRPKKYFYRRYAQQMWTPWEPVGPEIESEHIAAVIWRDRLHLFWVNFMTKPTPNAAAYEDLPDDAGAAAITKRVATTQVPQVIQAQLNWSEYLTGEWSERRSSDFLDTLTITDAFVPSEVSVHVSRDFSSGVEGAVRVHLGTPLAKAFVLYTGLSQPALEDAQDLPNPPFDVKAALASHFIAENELKVSFHEHFESILPVGGPEVCSWGPGRLDLFVRGSNDQLWHNSFFGSWTGWRPLADQLRSDPAAVSWSKGRIDVFVRGAEDQLLHVYYVQGAGWSNPESLGGALRSGPAVCSWGEGRLDVFVRGTDNALWHKWFDGSWSDWESLGGSIRSDPAAVSWGVGRIDVFARANDNSLNHKYFEGGWSEWESLGGALNSGPAVASYKYGRLDVFARGTDDALGWKSYDGEEGGWSEWTSLGGALAADPSAVSWGDRRMEVVYRGPDDILMRRSFDGGWLDAQPIDTVLEFQPPAGQEKARKTILGKAPSFKLVMPSNPSEYLYPAVGALMRPFFYQDEAHTLYVEPRVTDTSIERWEEWVVTTPVLRYGTGFKLVDVKLAAQSPLFNKRIGPIPKLSLQSKYSLRTKGDWLTDPAVALEFNNQKISFAGAISSKAAVAKLVATLATPETMATTTPQSTGATLATAGGVASAVVTVNSARGISAADIRNLGRLNNASVAGRSTTVTRIARVN